MSHVVTREVVIHAPMEKLFAIIVDYARYPEFLSNIKSCKPVARTAAGVDVDYELEVAVKRIRYRLRHVEEAPRKVSWSLVSGDWMKVSSGSWELSPAPGGGTHARYTVELQITKPALIPQVLVDRVGDELTRIQLPRTLEAFKARAERAP